MDCTQGISTCPGIPTGEVSVVHVEKTPFRDQPLRIRSVATGRVIKSYVEFPEEGIYIIYNNVAVQVAATACDQKACYKSTVCKCSNGNVRANQLFNRERFMPFSESHFRELAPSSNSSESPYMDKPCLDCLYAWMDLDSIPETAVDNALTMLATPMTLHFNLFLHRVTVTYDEKESMESVLDSLRVVSDISSDYPTCPPHILTWILHSWFCYIRGTKHTMTKSFSAMFPPQSPSSLVPTSTTSSAKTASSSRPMVDSTDPSPTDTNMDLNQEENNASMLEDDYATDEAMTDDNVDYNVDDDDDEDPDDLEEHYTTDETMSDIDDEDDEDDENDDDEDMADAEMTNLFLSQQMGGILHECMDASEPSDSEDEDIE